MRVAGTVKKPIWQYDVDFLEKYAAILIDDSSLSSVTIFDERKKAVVRKGKSETRILDNGTHWDLQEEVYFDGDIIGKVVIRFNNSEIRKLTGHMMFSDVFVILAVLVSVWSVIWILIMRYVLSPLKVIKNSFHDISKGDYSKRVTLVQDNELGPIVQEFNAMVDQVELRENALRESEVQYRNLVESPSDIIFTANVENRLEFINSNYERWTGNSKKGFIGHYFSALFADSGNASSLIPDSAGGIDYDMLYEQELLKNDGTVIPVELNFSPQHDSSNRIVGVIGIARDISSRKKAEEELRKYEQMVASITDSMLLIAPDYSILAVNDAYLESVNKIRGDILGSQMQNIFEAKDFQDQFQPHFEACLEGVSLNTQALMSIDGAPAQYIAISFYPIIEVDGLISGVVVHMRDITEWKKLEAMLQQSQKMEAIGTLAGGIAHDFNNIIGGIIGYAEMVELFDCPSNPQLGDRIEHVLKGAYRAKDLVEQILTFSRNSEKKKEGLNLHLLVQDIMRFLRASIPATVKISITENCPDATVWADETSIQQILMNLCTNAAHSMQENGGNLTVSLEVEDLNAETAKNLQLKVLGNYVRLSVKDTGTGINVSDMERIFDPFFTTKSIGEGTGMGLAVVHGIVRSLHGAISVESTPGEGSTFNILLPQFYLPVVEEEHSNAGNSELAHGKGCILFIDDEAELVQFSSEILTHLGYEVLGKTDSVDAKTTFLTSPDRFDLIITDQTMPNITGLDLAKQFLEVRKDVPIIVCTGFGFPNFEQDAIELGIRCVVKKPFGIRQLAEIVAREIETTKKHY